MKDVLGQAISDYYHLNGGAGKTPAGEKDPAAGKTARGATPRRDKLWVHTSSALGWPGDKRIHPREEMPVKIYFRSMEEMPELEWIALQQCRGRILDIGAGAGSHALALQRLGQDVTALEISPLSAAGMEERGVGKICCADFFAFSGEVYDTLLLMMNGIGLAASLDGLRLFF